MNNSGFRTELFDSTVIQNLRSNTRREMLEKLAGLYVGELKEQLVTLGAADKMDQPELKRLIHTIKGSSATFGAAEVNTLSEEIDLMLAQGENIDDVLLKLPSLMLSMKESAEAFYSAVSL